MKNIRKLKKLVKFDSKQFIESQHESRDLASLIKEAKTENSSKPTDFKIKEKRMLVKIKDTNDKERELIVVPEKYGDQIKSICHDSTSGYLFIVKTKYRLGRYFYWPNCYKEIEEYVKTRDSYQRVGKSNDKTKSPLTLVPIISEVFSKINFDACGPLPSTPNGNRYLIIAICLASKYSDAVPVLKIGSTSIIEAMIQIFSRMGYPKEMQTNQGTSFKSNPAIEFAEKFGIKVTRSSVHHPQSNPVERFHRTIKRILKVLCIKAAPEWERQVPAALFALRTIRHENTGFTPSESVYGRNHRTPATLLRTVDES
ncbi:Retrovirus-related Pol polyprotein from transposon 412 [Araneus ventricosus]|uniref:RNA-directed DNA polymerase n=1 Tax=Araneus ventricosus TaxID=182803 RepID=A0A4Y2E7S1_ARAVE|nr:Retrovirus-related Pol polyprotein from transposon 412 [Araneus ventricosus]